MLVGALHRLRDAGHSVVVVEHDLELAQAADWIVDLGPEAGEAGGRLVGAGAPEAVAALDTPSGRALAVALQRHRDGKETLSFTGGLGGRESPQNKERKRDRAPTKILLRSRQLSPSPSRSRA